MQNHARKQQRITVAADDPAASITLAAIVSTLIGRNTRNKL